MILKNELYSVKSQGSYPGAAVWYDLMLHAGHTIYQAHFPGEPITPGVCLIQIAKELLEDYLHRPLLIREVRNVKFLSVVSPLASPEVRFSFDAIQETAEGVKAVVDIAADGTTMTHISFTLS